MIISTATANPVLTATLSKFMLDPAGFVGRQLAPLFFTGEQSASYYVFDKENMLSFPKDLRRAPGTPYKRTALKLSDDSFNCQNRGIEIPVDDEERRKYATAFSADEAAMRRVRNTILINHEIRVRDAAFGIAQTSSPSVKWNSVATATPITDVDVARDAIHKACGMEANFMILPRLVFNALKGVTQLTNLIQYSNGGVVTVELLQEAFNIKKIVIAGGLDNTAAEGQTVVPDYIWGEGVVIAHVEDTQDLQAPNFMRTFAWTGETGPDGILVETYREDNIQSDIHRAKHHTDEKITGAELGYYFSNTLA